MSTNRIPEGMIPVEEFARRKDIAVEPAVLRHIRREARTEMNYRRHWPYRLRIAASTIGAVSLFILGIPFLTVAQVITPLNSDFQVNAYTTGNQTLPRLIQEADEFIVVWDGLGSGGQGTFGQRYTANGIPVGTEFLASATPSSCPSDPPSVCCDAGDTIVRLSSASDGSGSGVFAQRFDNLGNPNGSAFLVNSYTTGSQGRTDVACQPDGGFVVVWESHQDGGTGISYLGNSDLGIYAQRFSQHDVRMGGEFRVNTYTEYAQVHPVVASSSRDGSFVVVWLSEGMDAYWTHPNVVIRTFDARGVPKGINNVAPNMDQA